MTTTTHGIRSMTGFGAASSPLAGGRLTIELRSVNQRFLDVRVTAPREYAPWEATCRALVGSRVARGRVEVYVSRNAPARGRTRVVPNVEAARDYAAAWRRVAAELGLTGGLDLGLLRGSEIFETVETPRDLRREFPEASRVLARALAALDRARRREGGNLQRDMRQRVARLVTIERAIRGHAATVAGELQAKVNDRLQNLLKGSTVDPARVAQEVAYLAERSDVTEELVRLRSHLEELRTLLAAGGAVGKQIEFLLQETHREINTVGSKVNQLEVTRLVVEAKGEVERLREQVQNVE
ncbi:MAG: YicC family protein [Deltaproteobacteria bacterium]|nr:YicC family protein [Deltaproteobacteria bacterium]